jgi:hypothetical protein
MVSSFCACTSFGRMDRSQNPSHRATLHSGFMRQELKFGEGRSRRTKAGRGANLGPAVTRPQKMNFSCPVIHMIACSGSVPVRRARNASSSIADYCSPTTDFLIDTLPISNAPKSCTSSVRARSNRHSSGPAGLRQTRRVSIGQGHGLEMKNLARIAAHP